MATRTKNTSMEEANIAISDDNRKAVGEILNTVLSDTFILYTKTRKYHWNVTGPLFYSLHNLFEAQYTQLETAMDEVAERARAVGIIAYGTTSEFSGKSSLKEQPGVNPSAEEMVADLTGDHETVIRNLRDFIDQTEEYNDMGTSDFLTGLMEQHEKMAWMLRAIVERTA